MEAAVFTRAPNKGATTMRSILQFLFFFAASVSSLSQSAKVAEPPFTVTITTAQAAARIGSPIMIHIVLRSTSEKQINLPELRHDGTHGEYNYRTHREKPGWQRCASRHGAWEQT
jgi:hypothetical protein